MFQTGIGYSAHNTARSALSSYIVLPGGVTIGTHLLVRRLMKGVFETRPALPRYNATRDITRVLIYRGNMHSANKLSLKDLTLKVVMLLALLDRFRFEDATYDVR